MCWACFKWAGEKANSHFRRDRQIDGRTDIVGYMTGGWVGSCRAAAQRLEGTRTLMTTDGHHLGQHAAAHADTQGQGKLRLDARGRLRGKGLDELRGALRFRATRDNRGNDTACLALALVVGKIKAFTMSTFTPPFIAAPSTSTATSCAKSLPSLAAPSTSSATSCAKSFTCVFHVSPKGQHTRTPLHPAALASVPFGIV